MNRDPIGITCPTHQFQAGRTRCRWCGYDPIKVSSRLSFPAEALPRTGNSSVAVFSSGHVDKHVDQVVADGSHQKILIQTDPTTHYYGVGAGSD